jgi:alpha-ribazole phosphatase
MTLFLVRHAVPLIDKGICYGQLNVPADGEATKACAEELHNRLPDGIFVMTSTLQRCELLTAELMRLRPDLIVKNELQLQEMYFGQWEGRAWADIDPAELTAWTDDFAHYRAGSTGESVTQFMARVAAAFDQLDPATDTLWVTHAGVIRAATLIAGGIRHISQADQWPIDAPSYGQWCKLDIKNISQGDQ